MAVNVTTGLHSFELFTNTTGPTFLTGAKEAVNDAQRRNYRTLGYLLRGQQMSRTLQGGLNIQDYIFLQSNARARTYKPGISRQSYSAPQPGTLWTQHWRFFITDMLWYEEEIDLQAGSEMSSEARYAKYKDIWFAKQQDLWTDQMNYWERACWAQPSARLMEGTGSDATEMMSIPCFINEFSSGTPPATDGTWSTIQGVTAGTTNWAPQKFTYGTTANSGFAANNIENVISTLDGAFDQMDWEPPPVMKEYFEDPNLDSTPKPFIACSAGGKKRLIHLYRSENDRWQDMHDPWMQPTYAGFSVVYIAQLDSAALYDNGSSGFATEAAADLTGPRYYGIHPKYMTTVWHKDKYMTKREVPVSREEPTTHVVPYVTYGNLVCRSRARQFILTPGSDYTIP
jgi:hypothetical protein